MKKLVKLASVIAALALLFGATACSDGDDDDDNSPVSSPTVDSGSTGGDSSTGGDTSTGGDSSTGGDTSTDTGSGDSGSTEETGVTLPYTFDTTLLASLVTSDPTAVTYTEDEYIDDVVYLYSSNNGLRIRSSNAINYNGNSVSLSEAPTVGSVISGTSSRHVGVDLSKVTTSAATVTVTFDIKAVKSGNATADTGAAFIVDESNTVLSVISDVKLMSGDDERSISATVAAGSKVELIFSRVTAGAGGIDVNAITVSE